MSEQDKKDIERERFGRYLILDHLVDGGMAKICRARFLGEQADKVVAIKMVQPQFSSDDSFKTMFMDEIKLTFGLIHPNIVQTYDYGLHKGQLFVAMEYCDGRNLKEYLDKLRERKFVFPVEISVHIITQVCQGLHYAHTFTDKLTGKEANIIHRDISPHNIMLTFDGAVKIIDFGIAKSETNSEATQAGTIKGKLSYLAPEYLEGHDLDPRYDEFAVGITLWEMLCSRKLFKANNDLAVLKKIQECKVAPPSSINPNVPKELDEIVMKALHKDRNKRYENMEQLNRALIKFLYTNYPDFNATDLSYFAKELFKQEIKTDREKLFEFGKIDLRPYLNELKKELEGGTDNANANTNNATVAGGEITPREREQVLDFGFEQEKAVGDGKIRVSQIKNKSSDPADKSATSAAVSPQDDFGGDGDTDGLGIAPEATVTATSTKNTKTKTKTSAGMTSAGTKIRVKKGQNKTSTRQVKLKKKEKENNKKTAIAAGFALLLGLGYFVLPGLFGGDSPRNPASQEQGKVLAPVVSEQRADKANVRLAGFDKFRQKVYLDGKEVEPDLIGVISVDAGREVVIRVQQPGRRHFISKVNLVAGRDSVIEVPQMPAATFGFLTTTRTCMIGTLHFDLYDESRVEQLPLSTNIPFPVARSSNGEMASNHELFYQKDGEDIKRKVIVTIRDGRNTDLCDYVK